MGQSISSLHEYTDLQLYSELIEIADQNQRRTYFHIADAKTTQDLLSQFKDPSYIKKAAINAIDRTGRTPLHGADYNKTKAVIDSIPEEKRGDFVKDVLKVKTYSPTVPSTILDNPYGIITPEYRAKAGMVLDYLPTGTNLINNVLRTTAQNNPDTFKEHIATPQDVSDLFMGASGKSDNLKKDFKNNLPKYISYASSIVENKDLMGELDKKEQEILTIASDSRNKQAPYFQKYVEKQEGAVPEILRSSPDNIKNEIASYLTKGESSPFVLEEVHKQNSVEQKQKTFLEKIKEHAVEISR